MSIATPFGAAKAQPLKVEDPFGAGWLFHTVRDDSYMFSPWAAKAQMAGVASASIVIARKLNKAIPGGLGGLKAEEHNEALETLRQELTDEPAAREEAGNKALERDRGEDQSQIIAAEEEHRSELDRVRGEHEQALQEGIEAQAKLSPDLLADIDRRNAAESAIMESGPKEPEAIARLVYGWEGVEDDGKSVPFSKDALLSLLSQTKVGDADMVVPNGESGPFVLQEGEFATLTVGEALCLDIPAKIRSMCFLESIGIEEKKTSSTPALSSGCGSGTAGTKPRGKRTKATKKASV